MKEMFQQPLTFLNQLIAQDSTKAEVYYLLGNAYRKQGNWQGALNNYQEAIDLIRKSANEAKIWSWTF